MSANTSVLSVTDLASGYNKKSIFENLSFEINAQEVFGLVGLNGIGKTTLIKTILGLKEPFAGEITINPSIVSDGDEKKAISYLPERFDPPWFLSGYEFIRFSISLYGQSVTYDEVVKAAESISLNPDFLKKRVQSYSKGMRQKLGLLATVMTDCPIMILDEPMSGLDPKARNEVKSLIRQVREEGRSVLMSSHILADIRELCDRVVVFHEGEFIFQGTPREMAETGQNDNLENAFLNIIESKKAA